MKVMPEHSNMLRGSGLAVGLVVGRPVTPEYGALHCGVRDYAIRLAQALCDAGVDAQVMAPASWGFRNTVAFARTLRAQRLDVLHLQYPSIGHRHSLMPHGLGLTGAARRVVVTLHEHSALGRMQRVANNLFRVTANRVVFTTNYEARAFGAAPQSPVIPIGSNVPTHQGDAERNDTVLYFGQIRPGKGIEGFIDLAILSAGVGEPTRFVVLGSTPPRWRGYARALSAQAPANVTWIEDAPASVVAHAMATAEAAFLPFPDGASLRRGSLLAALTNGLPVIAPFGAATTEDLRAVLLPADSPRMALEQLRAVRAAPTLARQRAVAGRALVRCFDGAAIAEQHAALYKAYCRSPRRRNLCCQSRARPNASGSVRVRGNQQYEPERSGPSAYQGRGAVVPDGCRVGPTNRDTYAQQPGCGNARVLPFKATALLSVALRRFDPHVAMLSASVRGSGSRINHTAPGFVGGLAFTDFLTVPITQTDRSFAFYDERYDLLQERP